MDWYTDMGLEVTLKKFKTENDKPYAHMYFTGAQSSLSTL
jgi:hypothetical protein